MRTTVLTAFLLLALPGTAAGRPDRDRGQGRHRGRARPQDLPARRLGDPKGRLRLGGPGRLRLGLARGRARLQLPRPHRPPAGNPAHGHGPARRGDRRARARALAHGRAHVRRDRPPRRRDGRLPFAAGRDVPDRRRPRRDGGSGHVQDRHVRLRGGREPPTRRHLPESASPRTARRSPCGRAVRSRASSTRSPAPATGRSRRGRTAAASTSSRSPPAAIPGVPAVVRGGGAGRLGGRGRAPQPCPDPELDRPGAPRRARPLPLRLGASGRRAARSHGRDPLPAPARRRAAARHDGPGAAPEPAAPAAGGGERRGWRGRDPDRPVRPAHGLALQPDPQHRRRGSGISAAGRDLLTACAIASGSEIARSSCLRSTGALARSAARPRRHP